MGNERKPTSLPELRRLALDVANRVSELNDRVSALEERFSASQQEDSPPEPPPAH